jgi:hypothetical protein
LVILSPTAIVYPAGTSFKHGVIAHGWYYDDNFVGASFELARPVSRKSIRPGFFYQNHGNARPEINFILIINRGGWEKGPTKSKRGRLPSRRSKKRISLPLGKGIKGWGVVIVLTWGECKNPEKSTACHCNKNNKMVGLVYQSARFFFLLI